MRIIEAISDMNIGGAGVLLITRLSTDAEMREQTVVVIPRGSMLKKRLSEIGVELIEADACADRSFELFAICKYMNIIKITAPDIVNCHGCLSFRIAAYLCGVPVRIYTRHCAFPLKPWQKNSVFRFIVGGMQMMLSNGIIAVAEAAKDDLIDMGILPDKVKVIINGVLGISRLDENERAKVKQELSVPNDVTVVGIFARLEEYKGHKDLIEAASILLEYSDKYRFLIVGGGTFESELKKMCVERKIDGFFIFTGFVDDVTKYLNITDINVNCSHGTETSSLALSEGMSLGIPCIASNYGGNCYMVQNGVNGYIYPSYDSKRLARCISKLTNERSTYNRLSQNAYERYKRELNAKKMTEATYNYYAQLRSLRGQVHSDIRKNN